MNGNNMNSANVLPFVYQVTLALTALQRLQTTLTLAADSVFELHRIDGVSSRDTTTAFYNNNFDVQIQDLATGRFLSNDLIPQVLLCSPMNFNYREVRPVQFSPSTNLQFDIRETSNNTATVRIALHGYKLIGMIQ
jgi:hypothetical protein